VFLGWTVVAAAFTIATFSFGVGYYGPSVFLTACAVIGRVSMGVLLGDADRRIVAAANFALQAFGVSLLATGSSAIVLVPGCMLFGLGIGNLLTLPPLIAQREYIPGDVPRVVALITAVNQAVFAFAPTVIGLIREAAGGYALAFLVAVAVQIIASAVIILGRVPSRVGQFARD
jgi:cyanate permease